MERAMSDHVTNDQLVWADHYRRRASECMRRAETVLDDVLKAHFRFLAQRYLRLAEAEDFAVTPGVTA
jgi:hypothetical protein